MFFFIFFKNAPRSSAVIQKRHLLQSRANRHFPSSHCPDTLPFITVFAVAPRFSIASRTRTPQRFGATRHNQTHPSGWPGEPLPGPSIPEHSPEHPHVLILYKESDPYPQSPRTLRQTFRSMSRGDLLEPQLPTSNQSLPLNWDRSDRVCPRCHPDCCPS